MLAGFKIFIESDIKDKIQSLISGNEFVLFFEKDGQIYAADESGRLTFSRIKNPGDEEWMKDGSFTAVNLNDALIGKKTENVFTKKDLNKIHILDADEAVKSLEKHSKNSDKIKTSIHAKNDEIPGNMFIVGEK